jgi:hypothetical protein
MEDDLNLNEFGFNLNFWGNERQPPFFQMEDNLNFVIGNLFTGPKHDIIITMV